MKYTDPAMLPETTTLTALNRMHDDYLYYQDTWTTIDILREGATAIVKNPSRWLEKRPGETEDVYALRLKKLSYTPVMATTIREFTSKLSSSPVHLSGVNNSEWWSEWKEAIDGKNQDEREFLGSLFSTLLYFGRLFIGVDRDSLGVTPRSALEVPDNKPRAIVYEPLQVLDWGEWGFKTFTYRTKGGPLETPVKVAEWTFWTQDEIAVYSVEVKLNASGVIHRARLDGGEWVLPGKVQVPKTSSVIHGLGRVPMTYLELPLEMWVGNAAYLKQIQHFRIENAWTDAGTIAGIIQRVFTPPPPAPKNDVRTTYERPEYQDMKFDNAHVLIGSGFAFVESEGNAIANLTSQLETIQGQIEALASMGWKSVTKGAVEQSGASKQVDMSLLNDTMTSYGSKVAQVYQDVVQLVALWINSSETPTITGLNQYSTDNLDTIVTTTVALLAIWPGLPATLKRLWLGKLANAMLGSVSPDDAQSLAKEIASMPDDAIGVANQQQDPQNGQRGSISADQGTTRGQQ